MHVVEYLMPQMGYQEFQLPKWNARHGHDVHVITSDRYTPVPSYEETWGRFLGPRLLGTGTEVVDGVQVHRLACRFEAATRLWLTRLERRLSALAPDVVFCHASASISAFRVARWSGRHEVPTLMDSHLAYVSLKRGIHRRVLFQVIRRLAPVLLNGSVYRFLGVTDESCRILEKEQSIPSGLIEELPLGVDTEIFHPDPAAALGFRAGLGIPAGALVVMQTGKLTADKGPGLLAQAMMPLMHEQEDVWLVYVGSGSRRDLDNIREQLGSAGADARVRFCRLVPLQELPGVLSAADVCVYPAATSLSCLEASACGRAVVMSDLPISRSREAAGVGVCHSGDVQSLSSTLQRLLRDRPYRQAVAARGRNAVQAHFSYDALARRTEDLFEEALRAFKAESLQRESSRERSLSRYRARGRT